MWGAMHSCSKVWSIQRPPAALSSSGISISGRSSYVGPGACTRLTLHHTLTLLLLPPVWAVACLSCTMSCTPQVYYLGYGGLKQVDLSDDQVVAAIATDDWENSMIPVEVGGCRPRREAGSQRAVWCVVWWSVAGWPCSCCWVVSSPCCVTDILVCDRACTSQGPGEGGAIERLEMTREGFYQLVSLTSGEDFEAELSPQQKPEQPLQQQQQQQKK